MEKRELLLGGITPLKLKEWKAKYNDEVFLVKIFKTDKDKEASFYAYVRKPDLVILSAVGVVEDTDKIQAAEILFENCYLGGDAEVKEDDELKLSCAKEIGKLFKTKKAETVKV